MPTRALFVSLALSGLLALPAPVSAQAPADGLYEDFSSLLMRPVGPLASTPTLLPRWVEVRTRRGITTVTFLPDARVRWRVSWGANGPTEKVTLVDGEEFTRSTFEYDADGHLARKLVSGPGLESPITYTYTTDTLGRVLTRDATLPPTLASAALGVGAESETVRVAWSGSSAVVRTERSGVVVREDAFDDEGRALSTTLRSRSHTGEASIHYVRDAEGSLTAITVERPLETSVPADPTHPDSAVDASDVALVLSAPIERHEALLFLGAAVTASDTGRGVQRTRTDDWSTGCWMNETSGARYDASARVVGTSTTCICGFCVDASAETTSASELIGTDLHWTSGPWVRLDGALDVTIDHEVMTADGAVEAGELRAGDLVLAADGSTRVLRSVTRLETSQLRLGQNLRTLDGTFTAGGFLLRSESPRECPPPSP